MSPKFKVGDVIYCAYNRYPNYKRVIVSVDSYCYKIKYSDGNTKTFSHTHNYIESYYYLPTPLELALL